MRPSFDMPMELAEEGGRMLLPLPDGRDMSVEPLGWFDDGGELPAGRALP